MKPFNTSWEITGFHQENGEIGLPSQSLYERMGPLTKMEQVEAGTETFSSVPTL